VNHSLRRTLAVRFAATMGGGLLLAAAAAYAVAIGPAAGMHRELFAVLAAIVVLGTGATLVGAWWLAGSAVRPVHEVIEQATRIAAGTLDQRIHAHADTNEYRGLVQVLNRMLERLDLAFRNQRRLTADVSHELRSPLTALRGEIEVALRAERTPRDYQRVLHSALEEIDRLTVLSEDLLLITRAEAGLLTLRRATTDVNLLVEDCLEPLRERALERALTLDLRLAREAALATIDADLVCRLVHQLLDNAIKFTPQGGTIRVVTTPLEGGEGVSLAVEDTGPGIPRDELSNVFEPFYRGDQARSRGTGSGLGLPMAAAIARLHGGAIRVSNVPGSGARFEVELPSATLPELASTP
jgi:two-component system, OmpR family, sensor kinase